MANKSRSALRANLLVVCQEWHWGRCMLFVLAPLSVSGHWYIDRQFFYLKIGDGAGKGSALGAGKGSALDIGHDFCTLFS